MTDYQRIKKLLERRPYLVADAKSGRVKLVDEPTAFRLMAEADQLSACAILNLGKGFEKFSDLPVIGRYDREFSLKDIADFAGMEKALMYHYIHRGALVPSIRGFNGSGKGDARFSWADAFVAGIVGSLWRLGLRMDLFAKVQPLFSNSNKRADRELVTPGRP